MSNKVYISWELLFQLYITEGKSLVEIGELLTVSNVTINNRLKEYGIPRRKACVRKGHKFSAAQNQRRSESVQGRDNGNWKGGKILRNGYIHIKVPSRPNANNGYVPEHRLVMEKHMGRYLNTKECVHHKDGDRTNNAIENLQLCDFPEHMKIHRDQLR